jgi:suppressor of fused protein SUFU
MGFWERTWKEREQEIRRRFGPTDPPDHVVAFSWSDVRIPGACALVFPPVERSPTLELLHPRSYWLYLTLGLTQPIDKKQFERDRQAGKQFSSYGFELGFLTRERCDWPIDALYIFMSHITEGLELNWGDRFAFGFSERQVGVLDVFTAAPTAVGLEPLGNIRAVLFWPYLMPDTTFITSTGKGMIYIATGITLDEWELCKATTTPQLLLLLCRAGILQLTDPRRESVLKSPRWRDEWKKTESLGGEKADAELEAGIGRWYLND